jgi:hypothetical protein
VAAGHHKPEQINYRDPAEWVQEHYPNRLEEGDVVEAAGYPGDAHPPVRVVRNGKVVATFELDVEYYDSGFFMSHFRHSYCMGQF